ncbi:7tm 6 domain containing protein, partial [Asbolus verrucosus]
SSCISDGLCEEVKWYFWNKENKQLYNMFLFIIAKPFKFKFSETVSINYELGKQFTMERMDWKLIFKPSILMLKITGMWPPGDESYGCDLYTLYAIICLLLFQVCFISFQGINLCFIIDDLEAVTGTIFIVVTDIGASLKTYGLIKNMKMLKQLMITVDCDLFQPRNSRQGELIQPNLKAWKIIVLSFWFFCSGWLILCELFPILDNSVQDYGLPCLSWFPYNFKASPQYELTYFYQAIALNYVATVNVNIDSLIAYLNMYIAAQFEFLCDNLRNLHDSKDVSKQLKECIHHHKEILKFADYANRFYNWLLFVQFAAGGLSIGLTMFQLTVSSKIPYAVFESDWTGFSPDVKKNLIIFTLRTQRSLQISAFGLFCLSLETFVKNK